MTSLSSAPRNRERAPSGARSTALDTLLMEQPATGERVRYARPADASPVPPALRESMQDALDRLPPWQPDGVTVAYRDGQPDSYLLRVQLYAAQRDARLLRLHARQDARTIVLLAFAAGGLGAGLGTWLGTLMRFAS